MKKHFLWLFIVSTAFLSFKNPPLLSDVRCEIFDTPFTTLPAQKNTNLLILEPEMIAVAGGTFQMGSEDKHAGKDEQPIHKVTISSFMMGKYEVTNAQFCQFLNEKGNQKDHDVEWVNLTESDMGEKCHIQQKGTQFVVESGFENHPIIYVSWYGAVAYTQWLKAKTRKNYRLPTEAEWEYAAGNGSRRTKFSWGDNEPSGKNGGNVSDETAKTIFTRWKIFNGYSDGYVLTAPIGLYSPNDFGLHDMTGNVWEWCNDWYSDDYYKNSPVLNPQGPASSQHKVCRGGSWFNHVINCRVADRCWEPPTNRHVNTGIRVVHN